MHRQYTGADGGSAIEAHDDLTLSAGSLLLHIGPHKTGTTSLQGALDARRAELPAQGVRYAGRRQDAVRAVRGAPSPSGETPPLRHWRTLVDEVRRADRERVVISNEFLADSGPDTIRTIVGDLGPERVRIVVTLRPLAQILPSQWQQYVQGGLTTPFDAWLQDVLEAPRPAPPKSFWGRHRHDELIGRWVEVVGTKRVTVLVLKDDPSWLVRVFERLLALREGTLVAHADVRNRSLTWPEVEAVRAVNLAFQARDLPFGLHYRLIQRGACESMKSRRPVAGEAAVELPAWSIERVAELAAEIVAGVRASGVRVVGDLDGLAAVPAPRPAGASGTCISPDVSGALSIGVLAAAGLARPVGSPASRVVAAMARRPARVARALWRAVRRG